MRKHYAAPVAALAFVGAAHAQPPPGITPEMIATTLPLEGAPSAVPGPTLPVMVWGNGGCAIDSPRYAGFLSTIANWLLWQFKGDQKAGAMFVGPKCGLCTTPGWEVAAKRLQ
jgi:hypothetical protein